MTEIFCTYCALPIDDVLVSRVKGDAYHDDCIRVMDWVKRRGAK